MFAVHRHLIELVARRAMAALNKARRSPPMIPNGVIT